MRAFLANLLLTILLAGVCGSDIEPQVFEKGSFVEITVVTFLNTASRCYLVTPSNTEIDILANENLSDKYEYLPNTLSSCRVRIIDLDKDDEGLWSLHAVISSEDDTVSEYKEQINILIEGSDTSEESSKLPADIEPQYFEKGSFVEITVVTLLNTASRCYLVTPSNTEIDILANENLSNKYEYLPNTLSSCRVRINDLDKNDEGLWSLHAVVPSEDDTVNEYKEQINILIQGSETSESVSSEEGSKLSVEDTAASEEEDNTSAEHPETSQETESLDVSSSEEEVVVEPEWMSDLRFITRTGLNVDINLPQTLNTEKCTLTTPDGTTVDINSHIPGVTAHGASDYVSCRVVVGPMEDSLLGKWTLCGSYEENNVEHRRCQNAEIVWRSTSNPDSMWQTTINTKFNHVVHFGGTLTPAVRGSGSVATCHIVTPDNEDLIVARDREYPNIRLSQDTDSLCAIAIGPIAESHLGDWAIYGMFDSALWGYNEVRQPINMELYDKDDPYAQAYNVTIMNPTHHVVNLGSTIPISIRGAGDIDVCQFTMPSGETYLSTETSMPTGVSFVNSNWVACEISIGPITETMIGDWLFIGKFSNRGIHSEYRLTFTIIQEDPNNPIIEEDRVIQNLEEQYFDTVIGASHRVALNTDIFGVFESCHIRTPEGLQYTIMEGFHIPGVEVVAEAHVDCGVTVQVSEDLIGTWTLISREIRSAQPTERHLPFVIYVEETVEAVPNEISITEGNSMHVRLANPTDLHDTCKLNDPNDKETALATSDDNHKETCGFVVSSVDASHNGTWNIVYGTKIIYKAPVRVNVNAREQTHVLHLTWVEHTSVTQTVGPEEAVYCRVISPMREVVFDDFGRCQLVVDRVMKDQHEATWTMEVGLPGRIVTEIYQIDVTVVAADKKPEVLSTISINKPTVELTCSVTSSQQKTGCLFRGPAGEVLVASQGVSETRFVFHVNQTSINSDSYYYSCSLQITETATSDLGLWRCDLESEQENYYGFLTVLCPWAMQDPVVAESVVAEPVLTAAVASVSVEEREPATLSCSARAPLRYCYFRAPNGTVFNVQPGMSFPAMEYVGAGLDAGECGVRINSILNSDSGAWSCHAGVNGLEQFYRISVFAQEEFQLTASRERQVIEGQVAEYRSVDYCRFVRSDGLGFTSDNAPFPYIDESDLSRGYCKIKIPPSPLDWLPWTVVTKIQGRDGEISRVAAINWSAPAPVYYNSLFMWLPFLLIMMGCIMLAAAFVPARNRRWAAERASLMRASMRTSMQRFPSLRKKPVTDTNPAA